MDKRDGQPPEPGGEDRTQQQQEDGQTTQPPPVSAAGGAAASPAASRRWSSSSSSSVVPVGRRKRSTPRHRPYEAEDDDELTTTEIEVEEELDDSDYSDRYEEEDDEENGKRRSRRLLGSSTSSIDLNSSGEGKTLRNRKVSFQATPRGRYSGESRRSGSSFDHRRSSWDSCDEERLSFHYKPSATFTEDQPRPADNESMVSVGNVLWVVFFGWILYIGYALAALVMCITIAGIPYGRLCWKLKDYYLWPFGKYIVKRPGGRPMVGWLETFSVADLFGRCFGGKTKAPGKDGDAPVPILEAEENPKQRLSIEDQKIGLLSGRKPINQDPGSEQPKKRRSVRSYAMYIIWLCTGGLIVNVLHCIVFAMCWMSVVLIPAAKVMSTGIWLNVQHPKNVRIYRSAPAGEALNVNYYQYSVFGLNVILVNMLPFVAITLVLGYAPLPFHPNPIVLFVTSLFSITPVAYYIGMAVASIAARTNYAIGAMLNAIFGVSIEIILYSVAIWQGGLLELVRAGCIGSLLGDLLLLPGLSMIFGGIKYKEQRFSPTVAGVSSVLLIISIIGIFTPTMFWEVNGGYEFACNNCTAVSTNSTNMACTGCLAGKIEYKDNQRFQDKGEPLIYCVAAILPFAYLVGLLFTLKTHSHLFENPEEEEGEGGGHEGPEWPVWKAVVVLLISITLFSLIAEEMIKAIEPTLDAIGIEQAFAGATVMALVPSSAEYVNAITFAMHNNVALSLEIGSSSAVQICLLMLPVLVGWSAIVDHDVSILMFPMFMVFAIIFAVIIVNYLSIEGKANYFKGCALVIVYILFIVGLFFQ
ncbi:Hypothetical protein ACA1_220160 [Acanthamoeba castellanii str. Neff]|uniref:Sodium/calcium exchanger protein n=2 Tax=Acanthamoeba castellanii (strain ATCC 30010 / Neff) TaxID=1257118 RepID=L8GQU0_ACACF|nr:Hypothetical protein ACA1_220160 [Acanthamoeba castellanii str. Neff]ELR15277.1 Hypothetical protein ACA1_220160 [Acanthamoeba castellanii str. Neff]